MNIQSYRTYWDIHSTTMYSHRYIHPSEHFQNMLKDTIRKVMCMTCMAFATTMEMKILDITLLPFEQQTLNGTTLTIQMLRKCPSPKPKLLETRRIVYFTGKKRANKYRIYISIFREIERKIII